MTPGARVAAAIEVLDLWLAGTPAEQALTNWARRSRFAGSGDRAALRDHVYGAIRRMRSCAVRGGALTGRGLMLGLLHEDGPDPATLFTGIGHAPPPLDEAEARPREVTLRADRMDLPDWLVPLWDAALGADAEATALALRQRAPVFLRVNTRRGGREAAAEMLAQDGIETRPHDLAATALEVTAGARRIASGAAYRGGLVELQDVASQAVVATLAPFKPLTILDFCAGGGGKALALAAAFDRPVDAHDADPSRMTDLPARAARAGADIRITALPDLLPAYDLVLCDVPCSGSGAWRRAPDAKWRLTPERLDELIAVQDGILDACAPRVARGGCLAYVTCSVLAGENSARIAQFLARHPGWICVFSRQFLPMDGGDGFFVAHLQRSK